MCFDKDKKNVSSKGRMTETKSTGKIVKKQDSKKVSGLSNQPSRKQQRKGENPVRFVPAPDPPIEFGHSNSWICKNSACRAVLSKDDTFCKRCSCCICHHFDDNKDPSLWLVCTCESAQGDSCGLSCHIECALQHEKVGVVDHGQLMQLDGGYCCASCGKVTGILGCWKKQLNIAKDARRVDVLCYRIYLSYRLLDGTSRFKELHEMVKEAKAKLEKEVGPVNGVSAKMARGIVSRLPIASDVQKLCSLAIENANKWLATVPDVNPESREGSLPAACKFVFEEITASSVKIILIEMSNASSEDIKGYKLWYYKSREESHTKEPVCVFPKSQRRIFISNLQPCTEYTFRIVSFADMGDLGHSEAKCFTKSVEILEKNSSTSVAMNHKKENLQNGGSSSDSKMEPNPSMADSGFKVRDLGKILHLTWAQEQGCLEGFCCADMRNCCGQSEMIKPSNPQEQLPSVSRGLDLNVVSVPDLNEELTPPFESSRDEDNGCTLQQAVEADDDAASHDLEKNLARPHGSGDSQTWNHGPTGEVPAVDSRVDAGRKRITSTNEETHDCDSTLINESPIHASEGSFSLDENFEYCVKVIRWLECQGHIKQEFRLKLLTWFSLRSTEQERRVVNTFIQTLIDDPSSLAGQLVDSFSDIISNKRRRNGFCNKAVASS
ncbi:VIN3-like protein 1 isoform X2 [Abrus precatorius]|nr:VIN3-like protein 1 isoform X2 [Abrus precatorius]XP_027359071.1 VIN3-like protein 1 isoform X2 [Abrus precatorius]XP_027359072.1 VIN3-like protein 1 isoform X2 [Abrus precatorius]XP_027359073.1 VIN3-like protein 1 isoform X2 [Abrus precatorius]XP_027359074.1 VIN3-like protein 1 isoform X2 [Abrus precatorius]XP_027359075.1 VIN3-like protein 1 isoform X2 [Abrus precatorius]